MKVKLLPAEPKRGLWRRLSLVWLLGEMSNMSLTKRTQKRNHFLAVLAVRAVRAVRAASQDRDWNRRPVRYGAHGLKQLSLSSKPSPRPQNLHKRMKRPFRAPLGAALGRRQAPRGLGALAGGDIPSMSITGLNRLRQGEGCQQRD